ncbi:MAG: hypothetical protein WBH50_16390 [Fuerstiella sp.]
MRRNRVAWGQPTEALERRVLLTATGTEQTDGSADANAAEAEISAQAEATQSQYTSSSEQYVDSSISNFVSDVAYSVNAPDYDAVIAASPISGLYASSSLAATAESLDESSTQQLAEAQDSTVEAQNTEGAVTVSYPGVDPVFGDDTSVASYAGNLLPSSLGAGGTQYSSSSTGSSTGTGTSGTGTTDTGVAGDGTAGDDTPPPEPADPRMAWQPHVLPASVQFDSATIPLQSQLDNLFNVTPSGTESYTTVTVTQVQEVVTPTDEALGVGEKTENIKTSVIEKQEWTPAGDWVVTQTLRNDYTSTEDSTDADEIDTGVNRTSWTEFSVMVINGTRSIVSFTSFDSFSYGESSEYDDSKEDEVDDATGAAADTSGGTGTADAEDEKLDKDKGHFESSLNASSSVTVTFQQAIIQNADGTSSLLVTLSRSTADNYAMAVDSGFEIEDSEGDQVSMDDESDEDSNGDQTGDEADPGDNATGNPDGSPKIAQLPSPEHGGNGSDVGASSSVSLSDSLDESTGISVGAIIPLTGSIDDIPEASIFGSLGFSHTESSSGEVAQAFRFGSQVSQGLTEDNSDTHSYISIDISGGAGGSSGLNFSVDSEFGEIPDAIDSLPGSDDDGIPEPILGRGANDGSDEEGGLNLGFGVTMADHGGGSSSISFSEKTRNSFYGGEQLVVRGIGSGSSSGTSTSFDVGLNDDGEFTFSVSVTNNSNHGTAVGTSEYQLNTLPASMPGNVKTIELWEDNSFASIGEVSVSLTIGLSLTGDVDVDVDTTMSSSDIHTFIRSTETKEIGPGFNSKTLTKFWFKEGQTIGEDEDGNPVKKIIDITGSRSESINASGSSLNAPDPEDNSVTILLDALETSLDIAGMAPGVGIVPDLLAVGLAVGRGKWGAAGMSLAAAVPGMGLLAGAGKLANKGGKVIAKSADEVVDGLQAVSKKADDLAEKVAEACGKNSPNCFIAGTQVVVARPFTTGQLAEVVRQQTHSVPLEVLDEKSLDSYYAAGALALGVGLSLKPRRKQEPKTARRRRFWT